MHRALHEKRPDYQQRHDKLIFFHDNAPMHMATMVRDYLERLNWEVLLDSISVLVNSLLRKSGLRQKRKSFFGVVSKNCPRGGKNVNLFLLCSEKNMCFSEDSGLKSIHLVLSKIFSKNLS